MIVSVGSMAPRAAHGFSGLTLMMIVCITAGCGQPSTETAHNDIPDSLADAPPANPSVTATSTSPSVPQDTSVAASAAGETQPITTTPSTVTDIPLSEAVTPDIPVVPDLAKTPKREPIYDVQTSGEELIAAALRRARRDHKHVLVEFGGNWCGWCYKLHDVFSKNDVVRPIVYEEYELVLVDEGRNKDLMLSYGGKDRQYSYPHLTILQSDGQVLANQETGSLEKGPEHDPQLVADFLRQWIPPKQDAELLIAAALKTAAAENKCVLVRVGTPYCGWCKVLAQFLQDHEPVFATDYVDLKLDTLRMTNGEQVAGRYEPKEGGSGGVPWMVILDASGNVLTSSIGPEGNIGYPYQPREISHFLAMLRDTRRNLTDADLARIEADLNSYRTEREQASAAH